MNNDVSDILKKYKRKLNEDIENFDNGEDRVSQEYEIFRREYLENKTGFYERACNRAEKIIRIKASSKDEERLLESIEAAHLNITPSGALSFAILIGVLVVFLGILYAGMSYFFSELAIFLPSFLIILGVVMIIPLSKLPHYFANRWRLEASNQMVLCILYIVMYMRHTSNLEHAIKFASEHIGNPLALDLRKVYWNVQVEKYSTIKESLDKYLDKWRKWNLEFVEAFHLVEASLYEANEIRRVSLLEKSLSVILNGTYEKMLHYAHDLKTPITMLHMLGVILPILGLVIFPLLGSFMQGAIRWWHLAILYNIILPVAVLFIGNNLLQKRPTGYGSGGNVIEIKGSGAANLGVFLGIIILIIGFLPLIIHAVDPGFELEFFGGNFLDFKDEEGPYGVGALLFSLLIPLGLAVGPGIYYKVKTKELIKIRQETDKLEREFSGAIFQLGNRVGEGIPTEIAFEKVANSMRGSPSGDFFRIVNDNLRNMGMGIKEAIFNEQRGAILYYPSGLIESSMKILIESAKKGPRIVAKSLVTISRYIDKIRQVNERLIDLLSDIISSMKSQIKFLTPMIAGIVVGVASMVVAIINKLSEQFASLSAGEIPGEAAGFGGLGTLGAILDIKDVIPSFYFQLVVGVYVVEIIVILTILSSGIERGIDKLTIKNELGKNLIYGTVLYFVISLVGILIFNVLANAVGQVS